MLLGSLVVAAGAHAEAPVLTLSLGGAPRSLSAAELLARPDAATLEIPDDPAYGRSMTYRAVPLLALIGDGVEERFDTIEARAADGFVSQIPLALVQKGASGGSVAWIAVEDPAAPWPALPGKTAGAGPFYLVWEHPERSGHRQRAMALPACLALRRRICRPTAGRRWRWQATCPRTPRRASDRRCSRRSACLAIA